MSISLVHIGTQALVRFRKASSKISFKFIIREFVRLLDHTQEEKADRENIMPQINMYKKKALGFTYILKCKSYYSKKYNKKQKTRIWVCQKY